MSSVSMRSSSRCKTSFSLVSNVSRSLYFMNFLLQESNKWGLSRSSCLRGPASSGCSAVRSTFHAGRECGSDNSLTMRAPHCEKPMNAFAFSSTVHSGGGTIDEEAVDPMQGFQFWFESGA
eukprot:9483631-Pyramimonas_sp.AAC.2